MMVAMVAMVGGGVLTIGKIFGSFGFNRTERFFVGKRENQEKGKNREKEALYKN